MTLNNIFMPAWEEITLAEEDMDEKIGHWCKMLESVGQAGIPCVGWNFKPMGNFRTPADTGRGGVQYSTFDYAVFAKNRPEPHEPPVDEAQIVGADGAIFSGGDPRSRKGGGADGPAPGRPADSRAARGRGADLFDYGAVPQDLLRDRAER